MNNNAQFRISICCVIYFGMEINGNKCWKQRIPKRNDQIPNLSWFFCRNSAPQSSHMKYSRSRPLCKRFMCSTKSFSELHLSLHTKHLKVWKEKQSQSFSNKSQTFWSFMHSSSLTVWILSLCSCRSASVTKRAPHSEQMNPPGGLCRALCLLNPPLNLNVWLQTYFLSENYENHFNSLEILFIQREYWPITTYWTWKFRGLFHNFGCFSYIFFTFTHTFNAVWLDQISS